MRTSTQEFEVEGFRFERTGLKDRNGLPLYVGMHDDCDIAVAGNPRGWSTTSKADGTPDSGRVHSHVQGACRAAWARNVRELKAALAAAQSTDVADGLRGSDD